MWEAGVIGAISQVGFPVVMALLLFWLVRTNIAEQTTAMRENTKAILSLQDVVNDLKEIVRSWKR